MKVAIDYQEKRSGDTGRGIGFHTSLLVENLKKHKDVEIDFVDTRKADLSSYDIVHYPLLDTHLSVLPKKFVIKTVITIHDTIKLIYPKAYPLGIKGRLRFLRLKKAVKRADAIITISNTSKKDIVRFFGVKPEKIHVTYLAPQPPAKQTKNVKNLPQKFILYIGGVNYNKNLQVLAKASRKANISLVMVGGETAKENVDLNNVETRPWIDFLKKYKNDPNIIRLGFVEPEELNYIWSKALIYCQPSLYEGFGLPVLEAFNYKVPVVAAKTQALVEVAGDGCIYADPNEADEFAKAFDELKLDKSLVSELTEKGSNRLKNFSWDKTAKQTYEIYNNLLAR